MLAASRDHIHGVESGRGTGGSGGGGGNEEEEYRTRGGSQLTWRTRGNRMFFDDVDYRVRHRVLIGLPFAFLPAAVCS